MTPGSTYDGKILRHYEYIVSPLWDIVNALWGHCRDIARTLQRHCEHITIIYLCNGTFGWLILFLYILCCLFFGYVLRWHISSRLWRLHHCYGFTLFSLQFGLKRKSINKCICDNLLPYGQSFKFLKKYIYILPHKLPVAQTLQTTTGSHGPWPLLVLPVWAFHINLHVCCTPW